MTTAIDCTRCGACCFSSTPHYVQILPQDAGRAISPLNVHEANGKQYLNVDIACGHCALLTLTDDGRLACGDYDNRPEACRAFRAGRSNANRRRNIAGISLPPGWRRL